MEAFTFDGRYSSPESLRHHADTGAAGVSTAGKSQFEALLKIQPVHLDVSTAGSHKIKFGIGSVESMGLVCVQTPLGHITFHVVPTNTPFLYCVQDMDTMGVYFDNINNLLIQGQKRVPVVRKWGHPFMLLGKMEETLAYCHLTETELKQLHRRFGHPSVQRLQRVLRRAGHELDNKILERLSRICHHCQMHEKSPGRFKSRLKDDYEFNYSVVVDIMYLDSKPVLHVIDEATGFGAAQFLPDMSSATVWDMLRYCWVDTYQGPPDQIVHDVGTNFTSKEFRQQARSMAIAVKEVSVEAHNRIGKVERYYSPLRRAYDIICEELKLEKFSKDAMLQMAQKAINDSAGRDGIFPTLLFFASYPPMTDLDPPTPSIAKHAGVIKLAMKELRQLHSKRQVNDALAMRNGPNTMHMMNLPLNSMVRVWRENKG